MPSIDLSNMKRWIVASGIKLFTPLALPYPLIPEGSDKLNDKLNAFFEFRCDGPYTKPLCNGVRLYIEVNILHTSKRSADNLYQKEIMQGISAQLLNRDFCIYRTGNEGSNPLDDNSLVGVMQLITHDNIKTSDFGQVDDNVEVYQSVSEAHYEMYLSL